MDTVPPSLLDLTSFLLARTGRTARARLAARLAERDQRLWHLAVLAALADSGPQVQRELATRLAIDPSDLVKVLDDLTRAGQVERTRSTTDRRRIRVSLTTTGRTALADLLRQARAVQDEVLAPLDAEERAALHRLLLRLHRHPPASGTPTPGTPTPDTTTSDAPTPGHPTPDTPISEPGR
ncbi:MarR family winged helix-turn-helix transcriptional regulator [Kitasatospora sp. RB6PN24]|uniref:MarR family winged helix-turn-helix transcriptional regulator n=1 Tax=Kitasatospora humi TaxID=2893891 RepID=UPI001E4BC24C|nr:MarR family winged helix-turn-helix transcriptional regulator [Kitasatospora humi]MCC9308602.1 MarR family winged helix-turn-helix transcriptional regulator [Kitasatospora humi]